MRIGLIAPPWASVPPTAYGGTEAVVDRLARALHRAGHEVCLWTTGDSTCPVPTAHVIEAAAWDDLGRPEVEMRHVVAGYGHLLDWGADVIHDHTLLGPAHGTHLVGPPVVATNHGPFLDSTVALYRAAADPAIVAISRHHAETAGDLPVAAVIHHGLDVEDIEVGDGAGDADGPYLLFLGRMAAEKGAHRAAEAARRAGVRLVIAAKMREPTEQEYFRDCVEPLLCRDVTYVGEVGGEERDRLLRGATALVNPIRWPEPFGLVMIEALACGTPVVATRHGSAPELVDDGVTGVLCEIGGLDAALGSIGDIERAKCRTVAEQRFSTSRMVDDHLALYERVVADTAAPL